MKTLVNRISRNAARGAALLGLAALFAAAPASLAQGRKLAQPTDAVPGVTATHHAATSGKLRALMFPTGSPLKVKVSFENPALERLVLTLRNEAGELVYSAVIGRQRTRVTPMDLSALPDGEYTLHLKGETSQYSQPFRIHTETSRLALVE
ncbi:MAG: hypothetical protein ICV83_02190 [Cytophagales bacterium]|nr:hypothetical protein [Cytophagales bacterium]